MPDVVYAEYIAQLDSRNNVPSKSITYLHRRTLHLWWNLLLRDANACWINDAEGFARWETADSSPQGSFDWVMRASSSVSNARLRVLLDAAHSLCVDGGREGETEALRQLADELN